MHHRKGVMVKPIISRFMVHGHQLRVFSGRGWLSLQQKALPRNHIIIRAYGVDGKDIASNEGLHRSSSKVSNEQLALVYRTILKIITAFRWRGHYAAQLDPLKAPPKRSYEPDIVGFLKSWEANGRKSSDFTYFATSDVSEMINTIIDEELFSLQNDIKISDFKYANKKRWSVNQLVEALSRSYCNTVGIEFAHIENHFHNLWLLEQVEGRVRSSSSRWDETTRDQQLENMRRLMTSDHSALFLRKKFPGSKVFGVEGCESLLPGLWGAVVYATHKWGMQGIEMGMAHRGRINILHNFLGKSLSAICNDFHEADLQYGDVKYHLGTRAVVEVPDYHPLENEDNISYPSPNSSDNAPVDGDGQGDGDGKGKERKKIYVNLAANPSHLEAVNPVVMGKCKAWQQFVGDSDQRSIMPVLLHGDASFHGQGIVPECLELTTLPEYSVGGCIHIIINNQIGFTTDHREVRHSYHCSDSAKGVGAPIFHVNGDDVDAVVAVFRLAVDWRMKFKRDVVVDIVCYRRHGHNELEDPKITHPTMYKRIEEHPTTLQIYRDKLLAQGTITMDWYEQESQAVYAQYNEDFLRSKQYTPDPLEWLQGNWQGEAIGEMLTKRPYNQTGVRGNILKSLGKALVHVPDHISVHKDVQRIIDARKAALETGQGFTWAFAEALAFGCLMTHFSPSEEASFNQNLNGTNFTSDSIPNPSKTFGPGHPEMTEHPTVYVRLSGQDCIRGTFNQRHAAIYCQNTNEAYWQLNNLHYGRDNFKKQASISVCNSSLSEFAVLGFEYGFSLSNEMALTIFEAQFGDFANNAQCIIDNFIAAGEQKWSNKSSLVLLLPHGYDGQGPEHSSGRIERFLSLVDDDPEYIPGTGDYSIEEIDAGFDSLALNANVIDKTQVASALKRFRDKANGIPNKESEEGDDKEYDEKEKRDVDVLITEIFEDLDVRDDGPYRGVITKSMWRQTMAAWLMQHSERKPNIIVTVPSTPAQYFHVLRRQIHRPFSKPLVVMSAKWLLHHAKCVSEFKAFTEGSFFQRIIVEGSRGDNTSHRSNIELVNQDKIRRVIFCSGKIFYHLFQERESTARSTNPVNDVTIVRIEQVAPFPYDLIKPVLLKYSSADLVWCQEEPKNMGAYQYVKPRLETSMRSISSDKDGLISPVHRHRNAVRPILYVGRRPSAAPAQGGMKEHIEEQKNIVKRAFA